MNNKHDKTIIIFHRQYAYMYICHICTSLYVNFLGYMHVANEIFKTYGN